MSWPTVTIDTSDMDESTDSAGNARAAIKQMADNVNAMKDSRGAADGVASLDSGGKLPTSELPTIPANKGGTGIAGGFTVGDIFVATGANTISKLSAGGSGTVLTSNGPGEAPSYQLAGGVPSGARMVFNMTTPPLGWTKDTDSALNDSIIRIVTGTVGAGGSQAFSTWNARTSTSAHTLTTAQMPAHNHDAGASFLSQVNNLGTSVRNATTGTINTGNAGSGGSHSHGLTQDIKYCDFIVAEKD